MASKQEFIAYHINQSREVYDDAILLAKNESWNSCINRLYYSCYHLVSALLYQNEIETKTHNGTKSQFFLHFIKNRQIDKEFGKLYSHLLDWRQKTDYADFIYFEEETVKPLLKEVKAFNEELRNLINEYED